MKRALAIAAVAAVPGGLIVGSGVTFGRLWLAAKTGDDNLDRVGIRGAVCFHAVRYFGPFVSGDLVRALMAIINNESRGNPNNYLGDTTLSAGPSIGPMQVYRKTAIELGLCDPGIGPDDYAALHTDEFKLIGWGVRVFKDKLALANGDLADAIRRYNGGGDAAAAYRDKALAFLSSTFGTELA